MAKGGRKAKKRTEMIDKQLEVDGKRRRKEWTMLLIGSSL
jgi:hypothetical protein